MKTAAAYIRVSTNEQLEYSPCSQLEKIQEYVSKNGMILPEKFIFREDEGISGKTAKKRPEFMRMIGMAKLKPRLFDIIVVWKFSRFARSREDSIIYKSMLRKQCGIEVVSVTEPIGDDKMSIIVEAMIEAMDEYYSINLAEEVRRGMNEKVIRGEPVTAPAFGYIIKSKQYIADPDKAPFVKMIFDDYIGGMGCRAIAAKLNAMGIRTKRGGLWENRTVEYILRNPVYIGKIRWNPKHKTHRNFSDSDIIITDSSHEHILDDATWHEAQNMMSKNKLMYGHDCGRKKPAATMLQGLVKCSSCGSTLSRSAENSMQCIGYAHGKCSVSHGILTCLLEAMVMAAIQMNLKCSNMILNIKRISKADCAIEIVEKQIAREKQKLARIKAAYEDGAYTLEEYKASTQETLVRIEGLNSCKNCKSPMQINNSADMPLCRHIDIFEQLCSPAVSTEHKNMILRSFVDKIIFDRQKNQIEIFYYL
jgi:DNA invertase Pin-like site-specific DNA recombinase